jgi:hypothetical protein
MMNFAVIMSSSMAILTLNIIQITNWLLMSLGIKENKNYFRVFFFILKNRVFESNSASTRKSNPKIKFFSKTNNFFEWVLFDLTQVYPHQRPNNNYIYFFIINNYYFNHYSTLLFLIIIIIHNFSYFQSFPIIKKHYFLI